MTHAFPTRRSSDVERGKANGWIFAGVGAGSGITPPLITALILWGGWRASFYVCAVLGLAAAAIRFWLARDRPQDHPPVHTAALAHLAADPPPAPRAYPGPIPWGPLYSHPDRHPRQGRC